MKGFLYLLFITLLLFACARKTEDVILAQVNDEFITLSEFHKLLHNVPEEYKGMVEGVDGKERFLSEWIRERLLVQEAYRLNLDKHPSIIKRINDFKEELLIKELVKISVLSKVSLDEKEIRDYYNLHIDKYPKKKFEEIKQVVEKDALRKKQDVEFTRFIKKLEKRAKIRKNLELLK